MRINLYQDREAILTRLTYCEDAPPALCGVVGDHVGLWKVVVHGVTGRGAQVELKCN